MSAATVCVVQARTGSTRLPEKVLKDLAGRPLLAFMLERLQGLCVDSVVVATSVLARDDPIADLADRAGVTCVRGPEADVLSRFAAVLEACPADAVVRLTGDCPLTDPTLVEAVLDLHRRRDADYTCNVLPRTFPKGLDVEVARSSALQEAIEKATEPVEREHVFPYLYRHPERFRLANLRSGDDLGAERWTVDTPEDLTTLRRIVSQLGPESQAGWRHILALAGRHATPAPGHLRLRPADMPDSDRLRHWRNDPDSVRFSESGRPVTEEEHRRWFASRLEDPATRIWIAERDSAALGSVRIDVRAAVGTVSVAVAPEARRQGVASRMLQLLQQELYGDFQTAALKALVRTDNTASLRTFEGAGFRPVDHRGSFRVLAWARPAMNREGEG